MQYWNLVNKVVCSIFLAVFVAYAALTIYSYNYYSSKSTETRSQLLTDYQGKITTLTTDKIHSLYADLAANSDDKVALSALNHNLELCSSAKCTRYNLFKLESSIKKIVPEFINCSVHINGILVYSNANIATYALEAEYDIGKSLKINVSVGIDERYWDKERQLIWRPFWIICASATCNILLLFLSYRAFHYLLTKKYEQRYLDKYQAELYEAKAEYENQLKAKETYFMQKSWDIDFNKQKDLELNYLFAQAANKIVFDNGLYEECEDIADDGSSKNFRENMPCSIILYQAGEKVSVNISKLIETFASRFSNEAENISFTATSVIKTHHLLSEAALYQIIYSCISYLFYALSQQSPTSKYNINLCIDENDNEKLVLKFTFDGIAFNSEEELFKMSHAFFKSHSNPFILDLNQVFSVLKNQGFSCKVNHETLNILEIVESYEPHSPQSNDAPNNIILLPSAGRGGK